MTEKVGCSRLDLKHCSTNSHSFPSSSGEEYILPLFNFGLGHLMSFGQLNVNGPDRTRGLQCAYMTELSLLHSSFSHQKDMPQVH